MSKGPYRSRHVLIDVQVCMYLGKLIFCIVKILVVIILHITISSPSSLSSTSSSSSRSFPWVAFCSGGVSLVVSIKTMTRVNTRWNRRSSSTNHLFSIFFIPSSTALKTFKLYIPSLTFFASSDCHHKGERVLVSLSDCVPSLSLTPMTRAHTRWRRLITIDLSVVLKFSLD